MEKVEITPALQKEIDRQLKVIRRGVVDLLPEDEIVQKLARSIRDSRPLRIKQGFDPTSPDIHIGHAVGIRKLKELQDLGHQIVLIVGDYTAMVGDPSGQSVTRPQLSYEAIQSNAATYQEQFFRILDRSKTEVVWNGDWFRKMEFKEVMTLAAHYTVARLLERDDFTIRYKAGTPISVHELMYPLMQAYDSVAIKADVEVGGTDQTFNLLVGRSIQEAYGLEAQCILTLPLLVGTDGEKKMSKSIGNYIGITDSPRDIFGKAMSIPDTQIYNYLCTATPLDDTQLAKYKADLADPNKNPRDTKAVLGTILVNMYHPGDGEAAAEEFDRMFRQNEVPDDIPEMTAAELRKLEIDPRKAYLVHVIAKAGLSKSNSEARKLIEAGSVKIDGEKVSDPDYELSVDKELVLKVGKRRFLRLKP